MPYSSKSQQRLFHALRAQGKISQKKVDEYDQSTDFEDLPEKVEGYAMGGVVDDFYNEADHEEEHESDELHSNDELEYHEPVERMNQGGMVESPEFVKALRRRRKY